MNEGYVVFSSPYKILKKILSLSCLSPTVYGKLNSAE